MGPLSTHAIAPVSDFTAVFTAAEVTAGNLPMPLGTIVPKLDSNNRPVWYMFVKNGDTAVLAEKEAVVADAALWFTGGEVKKATAYGEVILGLVVDGSTDIAVGGAGWIVVYGAAKGIYGNEAGPVGGAKIGYELMLSRDTDGGKLVECYGEKVISASHFKEDGTYTPCESSGTTPLLLDDGNGFPILRWATTDHAAACLQFEVPDDYDETNDDSELGFLYNQTGTTDAITVVTTVQRIRSGGTAAADFNPTDPTVTTGSTAETAVEETVDISGNSLQRRDMVHLTIDPPAHTNDVLECHGVIFRYRAQRGTGMIAMSSSTTDNAELSVWLQPRFG